MAGSVERVGLKVILDFPQDPAGGSYGPVSPKFAFKPPDGAGLAVKGGPVKGGGYLFFDPDNEQYAGILELQFQASRAERDRPADDPDAGRLEGLLAADHHHSRVQRRSSSATASR